MKKILFVCTGNTCRSIMAEALFTHQVSLPGEPEETEAMEITSAGLAAFPGEGASAHAREAMKEEGLDLDSHETRLLSPQMVEEADLVLTMTLRHKETILALLPGVEGRVFTLKEYCRIEEMVSPDIDDPFGLSLEAYRKVREELKELMPLLRQKIKGKD